MSHKPKPMKRGCACPHSGNCSNVNVLRGRHDWDEFKPGTVAAIHIHNGDGRVFVSKAILSPDGKWIRL